MAEEKKPLKRGRKAAPDSDSKRHFLATMAADLIKNLKLVGIEDARSASEVLEEAAKAWLERRKSKPKKSTDANDA
jgi:hypothetical protein